MHDAKTTRWMERVRVVTVLGTVLAYFYAEVFVKRLSNV